MESLVEPRVVDRVWSMAGEPWTQVAELA
jgi:hypothetical protein